MNPKFWFQSLAPEGAKEIDKKEGIFSKEQMPRSTHGGSGS